MTAFEQFLLDKGFKSIGESKDFNTYDNCSNAYQHPDGRYCSIGLFAQPTRIGIIYPWIFINEESFTLIPTEDFFEQILQQLKPLTANNFEIKL